MSQTLAEKILSTRCGHPARAMDTVSIAPDFVMSHDNTADVLRRFRERGGNRVFDPERLVIVLDQCSHAAPIDHAAHHRQIRAFVLDQGLVHFFDVNRGICHQVLPEEGFALPGRVILGVDPHTTTYGALGTLAMPVDAVEAAQLWMNGALMLQVPQTIKVVCAGAFAAGTCARDLGFALLKRLGATGAAGRALEFGGAAVETLSIGGRMALCNAAAETGARAGYVEPDGLTLRFLARRAREGFEPAFSDADATFEQIIELDATALEPQVVCPRDEHPVCVVDEVLGLPIDQAVLGTCANGRVEDLWAAANRLRGSTIHPRVRLFVVPASSRVYAEAMRLGLLADLVEAGAIIMNPGCGGCMLGHHGALAPGEVCISTANRRSADQPAVDDRPREYLASPETVAVSALAGCIADPRTR